MLTKYTEIIRRMNDIKSKLFILIGKGQPDITSLDYFIRLVDDEKPLELAYTVKEDIKHNIEVYIENFEKKIKYASSKALLPLSLKGITGSLRHI